MIRRPPSSTRTDTLFPYTTLFRSHQRHAPDAGLKILLGKVRAMIAEGGGKHGIERFHSRSDGNGIKAATQHPGAFGCILQAFPAGEAGRKHHAPDAICPQRINRSEERRVGKECVSTCRSRWSAAH